MASRLALRASRALRSAAPAGGDAGAAASSAQQPIIRGIPRAARFTEPGAQLPARGKPRWQSPPGTAADGAAIPPQFPLLTRLAQTGHVAGVVILISATVYATYATYSSWMGIRNRRIQWQTENPEKYAEIVAQAEAEAQAKKDASAAAAAAKYVPRSETPDAVVAAK